MLFIETKKNVLELDLYSGCFHGCRNCPNCQEKDKLGYPNKEYLQATPKILPTEKLIETIKTELTAYSNKKKIIIGKKSDPYQPIERYYEVTRQSIEHLLNNNYCLTIQTKSPDILRDIEILERFPKQVKTIFCIPSLDQSETRKLEPQTATINERLNALKIIHYLEIPHSIKITPITTETKPVEIIKKLKTLNQNFIIGKPNGIEKATWQRTKNKIRKIEGITTVFE